MVETTKYLGFVPMADRKQYVQTTTAVWTSCIRILCMAWLTSNMLLACTRGETQPFIQESDTREPRLEMQQRMVIGVGKMQLPVGWTVNQSEYPSSYGEQSYHTVRASRSRSNDRRGLISVDISPSHPSLWREPLSAHSRARIENLKRVGPATAQRSAVELEYEALQYAATFNVNMRTIFRVFRQRSRVVTVAYTAHTQFFVHEQAERLVESVSGSLLI